MQALAIGPAPRLLERFGSAHLLRSLGCRRAGFAGNNVITNGLRPSSATLCSVGYLPFGWLFSLFSTSS